MASACIGPLAVGVCYGVRSECRIITIAGPEPGRQSGMAENDGSPPC